MVNMELDFNVTLKDIILNSVLAGKVDERNYKKIITC